MNLYCTDIFSIGKYYATLMFFQINYSAVFSIINFNELTYPKFVMVATLHSRAKYKNVVHNDIWNEILNQFSISFF